MKKYFLPLFAIAIFIAACHKSNPTIVGTWSQTSLREVETIGGTVVIDTTFNISNKTTYSADGTCNITEGPNSGSGNYTFDGNTLKTSTLSFGNHTFTVAKLADHDLRLVERDTIRGSIVEYTSFYTK